MSWLPTRSPASLLLLPHSLLLWMVYQLPCYPCEKTYSPRWLLLPRHSKSVIGFHWFYFLNISTPSVSLHLLATVLVQATINLPLDNMTPTWSPYPSLPCSIHSPSCNYCHLSKVQISSCLSPAFSSSLAPPNNPSHLMWLPESAMICLVLHSLPSLISYHVPSCAPATLNNL